MSTASETRDSSGGGGFVSPEVKRFFRRRVAELGGVLLLALLAVALLAVVAHHPDDPSWNRAVSGAVANPLGVPGAIFSDLLLQLFGPVALLVLLVPICHAIRLLAHRPAGRPRLRLLALVLGAALTPLGIGLVAPSLAGVPADAGGLFGFWGVALRGLLPPSDPALQALAGGIIALGGLALLVAASAVPPLWFAAPLVGLARLFRRRPAAEETTAAPAPRSVDVRRKPEKRKKPEPQERLEPALREAAPKPRVSPAGERPKQGVRAAKEREPELALEPDVDAPGPQLPPLALLYEPVPDDYPARASSDALEQNARMLESVLDDFGVKGEITDVRPGPVVTLYELKPAPGTKSSRVIGLADDIARSMSAISARVAVVPGRDALGIELPNNAREVVYLRELLASKTFEGKPGALTLALGKDIGGEAVFADLARMPHLLIAGTTGSGKSVAVNTMILSLLYRLTPDQCRMILIDPKMLELSVYEGIPHLLTPVVTEPKKAIVALKWAVKEMEQRYRRMSELSVRNITAYNQRVRDAQATGELLSKRVQTGFDPETGEPVFEDVDLDTAAMPQIVIVVDEMADLMMVAGKEIEGAIQRLAQMARAAGIHLIMATQRPSVDVITGTIKANFPTRISFAVTSKIDSRTILGEQGAEQLLGQGDMLYQPNGARLIRVHGPFVSDGEVERIAGWLAKTGRPAYLEEVTREPDEDGEGFEAGGESADDPLFDQAVEIVARTGKASTSFIQRQLKIGYNRAARIVEDMEAQGMVGPADHVGKREVLLRNPDDD
ncbi:MAG: DNA translocase FtsK 4TM domain-containing protein [Pseudomonadota bacterium]|nr:DNA translocase FtsK 4TM domain-containing protein [Pseudomonadota bacterium]